MGGERNSRSTVGFKGWNCRRVFQVQSRSIRQASGDPDQLLQSQEQKDASSARATACLSAGQRATRNVRKAASRREPVQRCSLKVWWVSRLQGRIPDKQAAPEVCRDGDRALASGHTPSVNGSPGLLARRRWLLRFRAARRELLWSERGVTRARLGTGALAGPTPLAAHLARPTAPLLLALHTCPNAPPSLTRCNLSPPSVRDRSAPFAARLPLSAHTPLIPPARVPHCCLASTRGSLSSYNLVAPTRPSDRSFSTQDNGGWLLPFVPS